MKRFMMVALLVAVPGVAQEPPKRSGVDAMLEMYIEAAKPVEEHKQLAEFVGPWKVTTKLWFDPGHPPKTATGTATGRKILGGRFVQIDSDVRGDFDTQSLTIFGFDRRTNEFTMVGFDDLGTYYITAAGRRDAAQNGVVLRGSYAQPPAGHEQKYHFVWTRPSVHEQQLTLYFIIDGKEQRVAETRFVR